MMLKGELDLFTELKAKNFVVVESRFFIIRNLQDFRLTAGWGLSHCNIEDTANSSNLEKNEGKNSHRRGQNTDLHSFLQLFLYQKKKNFKHKSL